jgi:hypothetical protein
MGAKCRICVSGLNAFYARFYCPFAIACLTIGATVSTVMPRSLQYLDLNHTESGFCPLLALQPQQQSAIFSLVIILASLMICSQLAADFLKIFDASNSTPQYMHFLSLFLTSFSNQPGIFQLFATR